MTVQSSQSVTVIFTTRVFSTGVGTNADSLPTGTLYVNGTSNAASVTVTNISAGLYKAAVTLPTLAVGDQVELIISATVSTIADAAVIWGDTKDFLADASGYGTANLNGDLTATMKTSVTTAATAATPTAAAVTARVTANTDQWAGGTIPAPNVTGVPLVDDKYLLGTIYSTPATAGIQDINVKNMNNVSGSAITTIKAVQGFTTADTIATYTGNTKQTADVATLITTVGTAGVGLTNLGDTRIAHLDADVSGRMATYTQPTGFLAATFPTGTVANTTNITAGTITTVTNLTNAPTAGDFTSIMKTSLNAATPASVQNISAQTGDSFARIGVAGAGLTNIDLPDQTMNITGNITGNLSGSVGSVTGLTASNLDTTVSSRLATSGYTVPPTANANADALLDRSAGVETGLTFRQAMRLISSVLLGKVTGAATATNTFRDTNDTKDRVVSTVDTDGNRSAVTLDAS